MSLGTVNGADTEAVLRILSQPDDNDLVELVELVAKICDAEAAGITVRQGERYHMPVTYGIEPFVYPAGDTFCAHTMGTDGAFCVTDAPADPQFADFSWVDGTRGTARFYASAPVYAPSGGMVGRLCVLDPEPKVLTPLQLRSLVTLALSVTKLIELRLLHLGRPAPLDAAQGAETVYAQLAAERSHDMRVPLTSIVASLEMLVEELGSYPDPAVRVLLERTTRAAARLAVMLDQNMQQAGAGLEDHGRVEVALDAMVRQLLLDSATLLETAGGTVEVGDLPVVRADPSGLYSVLQNLVTNSVKFARPGVPVVISISAQHTGHGWRILVRDNGVGIPEERRGDVFALFSRGESGAAGHGIGLATVARVIAAHGGRVGAGSSPSGGAEIWLELPDPPPE